jgi:hypothetical protein
MNKQKWIFVGIGIAFIMALLVLPAGKKPAIICQLYQKVFKHEQYFVRSDRRIEKILYRKTLDGKISILKINNDKKFNLPFQLKNGDDICINLFSPDGGWVFSSTREFIDNSNGRVDMVYPRWKFSFDGVDFQELGKTYIAHKISYPDEKVDFCVWIKIKKT